MMRERRRLTTAVSSRVSPRGQLLEPGHAAGIGDAASAGTDVDEAPAATPAADAWHRVAGVAQAGLTSVACLGSRHARTDRTWRAQLMVGRCTAGGALHARLPAGTHWAASSGGMQHNS